MKRRDFLKGLGGVSLSILLGSEFPRFSGAAEAYAQTAFGEWPMFRRNIEHTGFSNSQGRVTGPTVKWRYGVGGAVEPCAAVGDINGDGQVEVVISDFQGNVAALRGSGSGLVTSPLWQINVGGTDPLIWSSPAIADVDGDGRVEVVVGSDNRNVYVLDGSTGQPKWIFPTTGRVRASPVIDDIDGDGRPEIVIGSGIMYALDARNQRAKWTFPLQTTTFSSAAVGDIDGDGRKEVVFGSYDNYLYALDGATGQLQWQFFPRTQIESSPAIADLDGDGQMEVVVGVGSIADVGDKGVYALRGSNGSVKWVHDLGANQRIISSPAIGDVDGDGQLEVAIGTNTNQLLVFAGQGNGSQAVIKYEHTAGKFIESSPGIADIDGDGRMEIVVGSHDFKVYSLEVVPGQRQLRVEWTYTPPAANIFFSSPTLADIDGDGNIEVIIGNNNGSMYVIGS